MRALAVVLTVVAACSPAAPIRSSLELGGPYDFGVVRAGESKTLTIEAFNTGGSAMLLSAESDDPDFVVLFGGSAWIAAGGHAPLTATFFSRAAQRREHEATLTVRTTSGAAASTKLTAVSVFAECDLRPRGGEFQSVIIGHTEHRPVTVMNEAAVGRELTIGALEGADAEAFTVAARTSVALAPGQDYAIDVSFTPDGGREFRARFPVTIGDCAPSIVDVHGRGDRVVLHCLPDMFAMLVPPGATGQSAVTVLNWSADPVELSHLAMASGAEFALVDAGRPPIVPAALALTSPGRFGLPLRFTPTALGWRTDTFTATTSLTAAPLLTCLHGAQAGGSDIEVPAAVELAADGGAGSLTIRNVTPDPDGILRLHRITVTGPSTLSISGYYQGMTVGPGAAAELMLSVTQPGTWTLHVNSNAQHEQNIDIPVVAR